MRRRQTLTAVAGLVAGLAGCTGGLPDATGPRTAPTPEADPPAEGPTVSVSDVDVEEAADGHLRVIATVRNGGETAAEREVVATVTVDGDETVRTSRVRVPPGEEVRVGLDYEMAFDDWAGGSVDVRTRRP